MGAGLLDLEVDLDVVHAVACEAVDFVDDDQLDGVVLDVGEHSLQFGTLGGFGALAGVDELFDYFRAKALGFAVAGFSLSWDGESFCFSSSFGLVACGYAQVDHRTLRCRCGHGYLLP
ncbi:hypothetical protein V7R84_03235 [Arachnia propionica]